VDLLNILALVLSPSLMYSLHVPSQCGAHMLVYPYALLLVSEAGASCEGWRPLQDLWAGPPACGRESHCVLGRGGSFVLLDRYGCKVPLSL
jgi:hypothetical protein